MIRLLIILALLLLQACSGTNNAMPQASIPAPSNSCEGEECITISSPDSGGLMTVTANAGTVPDSAIVIITPETDSAGLMEKLLASLCRSAHAQSACSLDIPECADIEGELTERCQLTAEEDGSFLIRLQFNQEARLSIFYLDPTTCEEVETTVRNNVVEDLIVRDLVTLDLEGKSIDGNQNGKVYIFGTRGAENVVVSVDVSDPENLVISDPVTIGLGGEAMRIDYSDDSNGEGIITLMTDEQTAFGGGFDEGFLDDDGNQLLSRVSVIPSNGAASSPLVAKGVYLQKDFEYSEFNSCPGDRSVGPVDRLIFILAVEADMGLPRNHPIAVLDVDEATSTARAVQYRLGSFSAELVNGSILSMGDMVISRSGRLFFVARISKDSGELSHYLMEVPITEDFCSGDLLDPAVPLFVELPDMQVPGRMTPILLESDEGNVEFLVIPDSVTGEIYLANIEQGVIREDLFEPFEENALVGVIGFSPHSFDREGGRLWAVGRGPHILRFDLDLTDGVENPVFKGREEKKMAGVSPVDARLDGDSLIVLGAGLPDDDLSSLRVIDLVE